MTILYMEYYNNILCVDYKELTDNENGEPVVKKWTLTSLVRRNKVIRMIRGCNGHQALYDYESLPGTYKEKFELKYGGSPADLIKKSLKVERITLSMDARNYYENTYTYQRAGRLCHLSMKLVEEYTLNASVCNALIDAMNTSKAMTKALNNRRRNLWGKVWEMSEDLRDEYQHTLPVNQARLTDKLKKYQANGFDALISGKIGNANTLKITAKAGELLIALKRSKTPIYNDGQIFEEFNRLAALKNLKELKSLASVKEYLYRPDIQQLWYDNVFGELKAHQVYARKHSTVLPSMRDSLWYSDGTKLNLYYKEWVESSNGRGHWEYGSKQVYEVIDAYSECFIGYHISDTEDYRAQYKAYRMAVTVAKHRPYEIVHDNQGGHNKANSSGFLDKLARVHRPTAPYSGQSKTIESVFGRFQTQILHKDWRFTGQNITATKQSSHSNLEFIEANKDKLYTLEELLAKYKEARTEWNEMKHPATGISRIEMYTDSINSDSPEITEMDMIELFWVKAAKPITFTASGLTIQVAKHKYTFEVYSKPGVPDHEWRLHHTGERFMVKYDPADLTSVRLYSIDRAGDTRFERVAEPYMVVHRNIQEQTAGDAEFIRQEQEANLNDRVTRVVTGRAIAAKYGMDVHQQGLNYPKMKGANAEVNQQVERRLNKLQRASELSAGRVTKVLSNMTYDEIDNVISLNPKRIDKKRLASKL